MTWIDDQFLVSGSRDGTLGLWRITDEMLNEVTASEIPSCLFAQPLVRYEFKKLYKDHQSPDSYISIY